MELRKRENGMKVREQDGLKRNISWFYVVVVVILSNE